MMKGYYFKLARNIPKAKNRIVAIDTEWAKNWRAQEKFIPFCTSIHSIFYEKQDDVLSIDNLYMETEMYFRSSDDSTQDYIDTIENLLSQYVKPDTTLIGHQVSSDLHTLTQCSKTELKTVNYLIDSFKTRKNGNLLPGEFRVADTRYDIKNRVTGNGAEKLRNVSLREGVFAIQNELNLMSLTKMYNLYALDGDKEKREKLQVMNWRHAFQTALVWLINVYGSENLYNSKFQRNFLVTNDIMFEMGQNELEYLRSAEFGNSCTGEGILNYVTKYAPDSVYRITETA